ncbi:hypothetical protein FRC10_003953 [Ceratobasidium sp. 414]|nr:hypothetical protein FRC10_003953 [Ceratobasidium sp. 414]
MGRDTKPFINHETPRPAFPRRTSLTASFSLPTLSLSSRSKAPVPSLPSLDTTVANGNPLDDESASSSCITPSSSQPFPPSTAESPVPLKPPTSPGPSVPLPSIRSLRSRFSFSTASQDQANTPGRVAATPTQKRVTSRRFLPFGNSSSSTPTNNTTPTVPRKSLGDVFTLGRSSTSSRLDANSIRSATPSGRSSRSVTSAATLRGWTSTSRHLEPGGPNSRLSFGRPRSQDYSLDIDLGYVVTIGSQDETIRQRPNILTTNTPGATLVVEESSQEDLTTATLGEAATDIALPASANKANPSVVNAPAPRSNDPAESAPNNRSSPRQSALPPIKIPPPLDVRTSHESKEEIIGSTGKTPIAAPQSENDSDNPAPAVYPFTPVDDRSDVTSSTQNTPSSAHKSVVREPHSIVPPLPSPSPFRSLPGELGASVQPAAHVDRRGSPPTPNPWVDRVTPQVAGSSGRRASPEDHPVTTVSPSKSLRREHAVVGLLGELEGALAALSSAQFLDRSHSTLDTTTASTHGAHSFNSNAGSVNISSTVASASSPVREEQPVVSQVPPGLKLTVETVSPEAKVAPERRQNRIGQLLSGLDGPNVDDNLGFATQSENSDRLTGQRDAQLNLLDTSAYRPSSLREDPSAASAQHPESGDRDGQRLHTIDNDLIKLLSPHRLSHLSHSAPSSALVPTIALPSTSPRCPPPPLPSCSRTPQPHTRPDSRAGSIALHASSTSPSTATFHPGEVQLPSRSHHLVPTAGATSAKGYHSVKNSPVLSKASIALASPAERGDWGDFSSPSGGYSRTAIQYSPSVTAAMSRKRSASFDLSESTTFVKDSSDPFATPYSNGPRRADWLGPRTAKAFAAAGLLDDMRDKDRSSPVSSARSDGHRGGPWRAQPGEQNGRMGSVRSHSRLGSEIISPSSRARALAGTDSSPSYYRRGSLDQTAPPSPVSTHRTLVSSATSSSQSQQSVLQTLRERHELETEALLLALAGSKKSERDLRVENEQLMGYVRELEHRIAAFENERDQERGKWRRDRPWESSSTADVDTLDKRRQDILAGRPSTRGWGAHNHVRSLAPNRSPVYGGNRPLPSPNETPRSASAAGMFRSSDLGQKPRSATPPTRRSNWVDSLPPSRVTAPAPRALTPPFVGPSDRGVSDSRTEFEKWHEESFNPPSGFNMLQSSSLRPSNVSATSLIPELPGSMSLLVQEAGPLSEDEYSFGSASPASLTLVQPRNITPKPCPPSNISPITADFSFNSIPGSPRSLRLRPEEEIHLADLISLHGLEIADVLGDAD